MKAEASSAAPSSKRKVNGKAQVNGFAGADKERLVRAYREMLLARKVDEKSIVLYKQNKCHFQIGCAGHEAVTVAAAHAMRAGYDWAYPYYRDMAFVTAWGMTARELLLNALNKADDPNSGGRHMPMHYGHKKLNIVSQSSPTGTQFLQAVGAALAIRYRKGDQVVFVSAGEGTTAQGDYHEALNWAAREKLPVIFLIEDNKFAISVHVSEQIAGESVANISSGYAGLEVLTLDGLDYPGCFEAISKAVNRARRGEGPAVLVADVVRLQSHSISDNQAKYRTKDEIEADQKRDPIKRYGDYLVEQDILSPEELKHIQEEIQKSVDADGEWAEAQRDPAIHSVEDHVLVNPDPGAGVTENPASGEELFMVDAINRGLHEEMERNPDVLVYGQDVAYGKGGVFTVTTGLTKTFGKERCFNSPLAESSIAGTAVGIATLGLRPVVEIQFADYIWTAMMQLRNELATMHYRSNGAFTCPAVIRVAVGGYIHGGIFHSQNIEATFGHVPGLIVVYPSNSTDAKGLLKSAIRGKDPVMFLEHKGLYRQVYAKGPIGGPDHLVPLGRARIVREGTDATIITWGALVHKSLLAAEVMAKEGFSTEVIDLRTISPLDEQAVLQSVKKTKRLLVAHEDIRFLGMGGEIAALVAERAFEFLDAPVRRIGGRFTHVPHSPILEDAVLPQTEEITEALQKLLLY